MGRLCSAYFAQTIAHWKEFPPDSVFSPKKIITESKRFIMNPLLSCHFCCFHCRKRKQNVSFVL